MAMEFLYHGAVSGEPGLFFSFEEQDKDLQANAGSLGMDIARLEKEGKMKSVHLAVPHGAVRAG
jgi:circadian clock protein KaiC